MSGAPIVLVPGWWLGAWAWDEVAGILRGQGHEVTALTLPGLESVETDRSKVTFDDHVRAICDAVAAAGKPVVLAVHSGAGFPGYAATDRCAEGIAHMVYVDTGPGKGPSDAEFAAVEMPMSMENLEENENLDGISDDQKQEWMRRAVPEPGGVLRGSAELTNDARLDVPTTAICTAFSSADYRKYAADGAEFLAGYNELRNVDWIDVPTSHWPMFSKPRELADVIGRISTEAEATGSDS
ncbi:MAG TPA: alpha/beta hydrolase [Ilumatobacteraceae bacterium]|nr:alpha/beta hydrolase [Ilumatobacteraceae bacterium]